MPDPKKAAKDRASFSVSKSSFPQGPAHLSWRKRESNFDLLHLKTGSGPFGELGALDIFPLCLFGELTAFFSVFIAFILILI